MPSTNRPGSRTARATARVRAALAALAAGLALAAVPAVAHADSLTIEPPSGVAHGVPTLIGVVVETSRPEVLLTVVTRPVDTPACLPDAQQDYNANSSHYVPGEAFVTETELRVGSGRVEVPATFAQPGRQRLCAYLRLSGQPDSLAAGFAEIEVGGARGALGVSVRMGRSYGSGVHLVAEVKGEAEPAALVRVLALPASRSCPATPAGARSLREQMRPVGGDLLVGPGRFAQEFVTPYAVRHGRWRVCALLADGPAFETSGFAATATATIETGFKPLYSVDDRPRVAWAGRTTLRCRRGSWIARPRYRMTVSWTRDGHPLRGERRWTLRPRGNGEYRCRIAARNRHGTTIALAPPFPVQPWISR